jgi:hypothetical protein
MTGVNENAHSDNSHLPNQQSQNAEGQRHWSPSGIYSMQEWLQLNLGSDEKDIVIGTSENAIIRPRTKNLIEAAEKSFKTTFLLRLLAGLSCGETVYPELPVPRARRVLYLHGELSNAEIKDRTVSLAKSLDSANFTNFHQGRVMNVHLIEQAGRDKLKELLESVQPDDVAIDPWQAFIVGHEENSYKEISEATAFCSGLIEQYGVTLWIPIHLGKDHSKGARGHSTIAGWRDTRIQLKKDAKRVTVTVDPRWATAPQPFHLSFREGTLWPVESSETRFAGQATRMREFLAANGGNVSSEALREHLQLKPEAFRKATDRAQKDGAIIKGKDFIALPLEPTVEDQISVQ